MNDEALVWLRYAEENLKSASVLLESELFNPCLQNAQQAVEKLLKALLIEHSLEFRRTHSIAELKTLLEVSGMHLTLSEDECDLLDAVYLPSKYPLGSVLPDFEPDAALCRACVAIAQRLAQGIQMIRPGDTEDA